MTVVEKRKLKQKVQYEIREVLTENGADDETLFLSLLYALETINIDLASFNDILAKDRLTN